MSSIVDVVFYCIACFLLGVVVGRLFGPKRQVSQGRVQRDRGDDERVRGNGTDVELYVGNLSYDVDERELRKIFEAHGKVASSRLIQNKFNGKSRGYGFVEMSDRSQAMAAIRALNGNEIKGRRIVVNEAKSEAR